MNCYLKNLNKIEFVITYACTGKCKHCSEGEHKSFGEYIDPNIAAEAVKCVAASYNIKTVMTFGGEPLLYPKTVYAVMSAAKELDIPKRQVITNGYFSRNIDKIREVAKRLAECGVNDLRLSVDAFHQESIPLDIVRCFAIEAKNSGLAVTLQPAWLVSPTDDNPYNIRTREIFDSLADIGLQIGEGNVIFPEGNALKHLSEYFKEDAPINPYVDDEYDVRCLSFSPNGDVLDGNIYKNNIIDIIKNYSPKDSF